MRKNNKAFVTSMIITSIIGLSVLMIAMFIGIKYFINQNEGQLTVQPESLKKEERPNVQYSSTILALVESITDKEIIAFDIEKMQSFQRELDLTTTLTDSYGGAIPLGQIKKGSIVEIVYQPEKESILSVSLTNRAWEKNNISGLKVNTSDNKITINNKDYSFTKDILVIGEEETESSPYFITEHDVVKVVGVEDTIWCIRILKSAASIEITNLPTADGILEIDRTRMIPLKEVIAPISIEPGKHKITIIMKGYETVTKDITIEAGEKAKIDLTDTPKAMSTIKLTVTNQEADYTVRIGDKVYTKGEILAVEQGKHTVNIEAEGYKPWTKELEFTNESHDLKVSLEQIKADTGTTLQQPEEVNSSNTQYTITVSSDPVGAAVYVGDTYKGQTPVKMTLPLGDYAITLKKEGYQNHTANILLDSTGTQNNFLYVLMPQ
ncbi:hypothetical protein CS063_16205 [Sporanaerobium hydrogeniformans]|uniref:Uncharacterized protein n=1 Tax=Sporanaerobium hydrogeniformans TaxID=3072179 RepID=A0AC61D6U0_9FIRM|nr:PEGA domain-containing protein [Sporanaerobium hydrogeniformans]PHV69376.1 hypothetical protein CS063_16205 [Sporanaerobium hydrogeniformans]